MDNIDSVWQISIIALVAGAMIGVLAYRLLAPSVKQADKTKTELDEAREEMESYKTSVNQHFDKTSELVKDLTQNYVKVYQHLSEGAQTLGDSKTFTGLLEQHEGRVSIAVDDETKATDEDADNVLVDPAVTQPTAVETVDEHAEPFSGANAAGTESVSSEDDAAKTSASSSADSLGDSTETEEPTLNIDALEEVTDDVDIEVPAEADSTAAEGKEKTEARTTTH